MGAACVGVVAAEGGSSDQGAPDASLVKRGVLGHHGHNTAYGVYQGYNAGHGHGRGHGYSAVGHGHGYTAGGHGGHGYVHHKIPKKPEPTIPACAANSSRPWCLEDAEYPTQEIQHAAEHSFHLLLPLYTDVANLNTDLSLSRPINTLQDETYLCPSSTSYVKPLRAVNTDGHWRIIVNNIELYKNTLTQTSRVEVCLTSGQPCPKIPDCIGSSCLEKSVYHRFLVYDEYDHHFPFAIESFALPASCACLLNAH